MKSCTCKVVTDTATKDKMTTDVQDERPFRIYLAGPLFTMAERDFNKDLAQRLRDLGYNVFLPQEEEPRDMTAKSIFEMDVKGIDDSDVILAIMDGPDPDSGTCWECGYGYARGKAILTLRTDFRNCGDGDFAPFNLMISECSDHNIILSCLRSSTEEIVASVNVKLRSIKSRTLRFVKFTS